MSDSSKNANSVHSSPQQSTRSPSIEFSAGSIQLDQLLPMADLSSGQLLPASPAGRSPSGSNQMSSSEGGFVSLDRESWPSKRQSSEEVKPRPSLKVEPAVTKMSLDKSPRLSMMKDEVSSAVDDTLLKFSMRVKTRVPVAPPDTKSTELRDHVYDPTRYRPQVLVNDWFEVTQRLELNKHRNLKLQKGPDQSAYDYQFQHPFATRLVEDPEESAKKKETRARKLWTYLTNPTEYSEHFNEPYRKK